MSSDSGSFPRSEIRSGIARQDSGIFCELLGDGSGPLIFTGLCLVLSGAFAIFLSALGQFLPHDVAFLEMTGAVMFCTGIFLSRRRMVGGGGPFRRETASRPSPGPASKA